MKGKSVLVSGASSGIGFAIAKRFAEEGANIFFTYKSNESGANMLINQITENGGFCVGIKTDHSVFSNAKDVYDKVKSHDKSIDILINNAGISKFELADTITEESWNEIWNTNVTSMVALTKFFLPDFINKKSGHIINISSVWGQRGSSMETAYSTTKGAVDAYTKALAKELAPSGISVNAISCGYIDTKMNSHLSTKDVESIIEEIPAGRVGTPSDVAELALNITKTNSYMTGQIIGLDGGWQV